MKKLLKIAMVPAIASVALLASCNRTSDKKSDTVNGSASASTVPQGEIKFTYDGKELKDGGAATINVGENLKVISVKNGKNTTFVSSNTEVLEVGATTGKLNAKKAGECVITATDSGTEYKFNFTVKAASSEAGTFSYADASYDEKAKILGVLEKYAVDNYLTGITLFSDGGRVVYNSRYVPTPSTYISGYGWGTEREGKLNGDLPAPLGGRKNYYQVGMVTIPNRADVMNASGSDVSDLSAYITSAYYGTRLNQTNDGYEWYPILATSEKPIALVEDGVDDKGYTKVKVGGEDVTQSDRWRIYVRTGQGGNYKTNAPKYKTASTLDVFKKYNDTYVQAKDYLTPFQWMLTSANGQSRGAELLDGVSGFAGAAEYYASSSEKTKLDGDGIYNKEAWEKYMTKGHNIVMGTDSNGTYIDFRLSVPCTQFFAEYYLSSNLYSPLPAEILKEYPTYGTEPSTTLNNTTISCGAYYIQEKSATALTLTRNGNFIDQIYDHDKDNTAIDKFEGGITRKIYQMPGFQWTQVSEDKREENFKNGKVDSYSPTKDTLKSYTAGSGHSGAVDWNSYTTQASSTFKINVNSLTADKWQELFGTDGKSYVHNSSDTNLYVNQRKVRKYMSDKNFLDFLSFGLDRKTISEARGKEATQDYFADAYISDPENGIAYNSTSYHKAVLADRHPDTYGYDVTDAGNALTKCIKDTIAPMKSQLPTENGKTVVQVDMDWMNPTDVKDYGDVFDSWKSIFEDVVNKKFGKQYVLKINQVNGTSDYNAVYDKMKRGEYDLGFGAVSGNTMNPLNFLEVLKSDNSSGFTLNWGKDTSEVSDDIVYDGKKWSFDSLWNAGNNVAVLNSKGVVAVPTTTGYSVKDWVADSAKEQVSYEVAFDDLIAAGAKIKSIRAQTDAANAKVLYIDETAATKIDENNKTFKVVLDKTFNNTGIEGVTEGSNKRQENVAATVTLTVSYTIKVGGADREMNASLSLSNYYSIKAKLEEK